MVSTSNLYLIDNLCEEPESEPGTLQVFMIWKVKLTEALTFSKKPLLQSPVLAHYPVLLSVLYTERSTLDKPSRGGSVPPFISF